jgi:hypothetical protein
MRPAPALTLLAAFGGLVVGGCASRPAPTTPAAEPAGPVWFEDVTDRLGVRFTHDPGPVGSYRMPQIVGTGCAVFDCDADGRLDLYLMHNVAPGSPSRNVLYRQRPDGTFEDVSAGSGLDFAGPCMGVAVGDADNDGRPDLLVTLAGGVRLFLNSGGGKFADVTDESGLRNPLWGTSAAFFDYDRDGRLDLFVVNYVDYDPSVPCTDRGGQDYCAPKTFSGTVSRLFHNLGPAAAAGGRPAARARFEDVSVLSGVGTLPGPGLGVYCADLTGDAWPDVFVANDGAPNRLWVNQQNGTFKDEAISRGVAYTHMGQAFAGMGIAAGDVDNDGLIDLYVTHLASETNTFWKQGPRGLFRDRTTEHGLTATGWRGTGFGTAMADFNHDGWADLALVNGRVSKATPEPAPGLPTFWEPYAQRNQVLTNGGNGRFTDVSAANPAFCGVPNVGRGLACGDIDGDGAVDLVVTATAGRARVYRNVCPDRGHWLQVRAVDPRWNRDALGAEVVVTAAGQRYLRVVSAAESYLSSSSPVAHFGLGQSAAFDAVEVKWPDGLAERFPGGAADRAVPLRRGEGTPTK